MNNFIEIKTGIAENTQLLNLDYVCLIGKDDNDDSAAILLQDGTVLFVSAETYEELKVRIISQVRSSFSDGNLRGRR